MADQEASQMAGEAIKIPVFSVLKNGIILKNIFLKNPQWEPEPRFNLNSQEQEDDPILIGRHPDCHIVQDHPSISRFHLKIQAKPVSGKLTVTDLSSVHGTWVSGSKIQPKIPIDLMEGDTVKLGASTRVYELHWVPLNGANEMEQPLPALLEEENEETHQLENPKQEWEKEIPSAPPIPESFSSPSERDNRSPLKEQPSKDISNFSSVALISESVGSSLPMKRENRTPEKNTNEMQSEDECMNKQVSEKKGSSLSLLSRRSKSKSVGFLSIQTGRNRAKINKEAVVTLEECKREKAFCRVLFGNEKEEEEGEEEIFVSDKENMTPLSSMGHKSLTRMKEPSVKYLNEEFGKQDDAFYSDNENWTPEIPKQLKSKKPILINEDDEEEENAAFYSDKENMTPLASGVKKSKKVQTESQARIERAIVERRRERVPFQSLFQISPLKNGSPLSHKIVEVERVPFQSIPSSPLRNSSPINNSAQRANKYSTCSHTQITEDELSHSSSHSVGQVQNKAGGEKNKWYMVVDTGCFLNEESRKSLQLLEGLRGTQLIIPRIVIRELDCLKRHESLFRKETKVASLVLQWIEECMVSSSWWIHVQSSSETMPVAATPPATPRSQLGDGSYELGNGASKSMPFSTCGTLMEIVSPTAEDHIVDCALLFTGIKEDGQLVLLTNSTTLKIKSMAEGLLCEAPNEFRESLVNPYSKRFLWADSSPRGSTWSCSDAAAIIENYYNQFQAGRKTAKVAESVKGLKLILLHNSHYGKS